MSSTHVQHSVRLHVSKKKKKNNMQTNCFKFEKQFIFNFINIYVYLIMSNFIPSQILIPEMNALGNTSTPNTKPHVTCMMDILMRKYCSS